MYLGKTKKAAAAAFTAVLLAASQVPYRVPSVTAYTAPASYTNEVTFTDSGITPKKDTGISWEGTALSIDAAGTYLITGSCADGSIEVKKGVTGVVLVLSDLTLSSSSCAPISAGKDSATVLYIEGTCVITDAEDPADETSADKDTADAFDGAAVKVKSGASLTIDGNGELMLNSANCKNGIKGGAGSSVIIGEKSDDSFTIVAGSESSASSDSFTLAVNAAGNALAGDGRVIINGGVLNLTADGDGIKSSPDSGDTDSKGTVTVNGGKVTIVSGDDGIQGDNGVSVNGGEVTITAGGGSVRAASESTAKGIVSDGFISISGGTVKVDASDDAVHLNGTAEDSAVSITGGLLELSAGGDGIHSDYLVNIGTPGSADGPDINVLQSNEGIEGATVNLYSGKGSVFSDDDGINAANSDLTSYGFALNISGGEWYVNAEGDGVDSNGDLNISGGYSEIYGAASGGNGAFDYGDVNSGFNVTGGTAAGIGFAQMAAVPTYGRYVTFGVTRGMNGQPGGQEPPAQGGEPPAETSGTAVTINKNDKITIKNSAGTVLFNSRAPKKAEHIVFTSESLDDTDTYTLFINDEEAASSKASFGGSPDAPPVQTYRITIPAAVTVTRGGTAVPNGASVRTGDVLTITAAAQTGKTLTSLKVNGRPVASGSTYTVGSENVVITAEYSDSQEPAAGQTISGKVSVPGSAGAVKLELIDSTGKTAAQLETSDGTYRFDGVAGGKYTMRASKNGCAPRTYTVTVANGTVSRDIDLRLYGDLNGDGTADSKDSTQILKYEIGDRTIFSAVDSETRAYLLKVGCLYGIKDSTAVLSSRDATQILRHEIRLPSIYDII